MGPRTLFLLLGLGENLGWRWGRGWTEEVIGEPPHPPGQFLLLGVPDGHFQHQLWGDLEELRVIAIGLEQEWQDIEAASWGFPALLNTDLQTESLVTPLPLPLLTQQAQG